MSVLSVLAPAFSAILIGALVGMRFAPSTAVLSKLLIHVLVPAAVLSLALSIEPETIRGAGLFLLAFLVHTMLVGGLGLVAGVLKPLRGSGRLLALGGMIYNLGNFGVPMLLLAGLRTEAAFAGAALVLQIVITFLIGIPLLSGEGIRRGLSTLVRYPVTWAILVSATLIALEPRIPAPIAETLAFIAAALPAVALLTIGIQLVQRHETGESRPSLVVTLLALRHVISPLVALATARVLGLGDLAARVLVIMSLLPIAANVYVLADEFDVHPAAVARAVGVSTLMSAATIPFLIA